MKFPTVSEGDVSAPIKTWLAHGSERMKKSKEKEEARDRER